MKNLEVEGQLAIGALARLTGLNVSAIRYYEEIGLIPAATRRPSGHRIYDAQVQHALTFIRHSRDFGFSIEETRALVSLGSSADRDCVEAREIAQGHLDAVRAKISELQALERSLGKFVRACTDECAGGPAAQCTILKDLSATPSRLAPVPSGCCG